MTPYKANSQLLFPPVPIGSQVRIITKKWYLPIDDPSLGICPVTKAILEEI